MRPDDRVRVPHRIEAAEAVAAFIAGRDRMALDQDRMLLFALVRAIEIIGEAASRISADAKLAAPAIPWRRIMGMRNRLIHAYFEIDKDILRRTAAEEVPALHGRLASLAEDRGTIATPDN